MATGARSFGLLGAVVGAGAALTVAVVLQMLPALGVGGDPANRVREADEALLLARTPADLEAAAQSARSALASAPLTARAVTILAQTREQQGRSGEVEPLMRMAARLSHREDVPDLWLFDRALRARRYDEAFIRADAVLRRDELRHRRLFPVLHQAAIDPAAVKPLAARLALRPAWREFFFHSLFYGQAMPGFVYPLFEAMEEAGSPPAKVELEGYLIALARNERYEQAYLTWLLSMSPQALGRMQYVYDGAFNGEPAVAPFGWQLRGSAGGNAVMEEGPGGGRSLLINSDGYTAATFAEQLLVLPPGAYRLSGRIRAPANAAAGELGWTLTCRPASQPLLSAKAQPTQDQWRRFTADFSVPAGCPAQMLSLNSTAGERRTSMTVWFDDIAVDAAEAGRP